MSIGTLESLAHTLLVEDKGPLTAARIREVIESFRLLPMCKNVSDEDAENLAREFEEKFGISMGLGAIVSDDFEPWLHAARINGEVRNFYWKRYRELLRQKKLPKAVIEATDEVTDKILDRLGNPRDPHPWSRLGLVVGHVQSGKTANYTGLICKAADAGYRLIVVIAGIHNNLRNQTQARIDEGFIGRDTGHLAHQNKVQRPKIIGVGNFDQREFPVSLTNTIQDFNKATATTNTSQIGQYNVPVVLVIKKNANTLKNLLEWLETHSAKSATNMVHYPMLLIDDEADNASINTKYARDEVTKINSQIRDLLAMFERSSYVGYTATPFANIFIDPDTDDDALKEDLFPRHFIIGLDAPSNYFGGRKIFLDNTDDYVREISDNEATLPVQHKIALSVDGLPTSLVDAIRTFIVGRAIRNVRGQHGEHASMLVNVSRFTAVQGRVRSRIADVVETIRDAVAVDGSLELASSRNAEISRLHETWEREFLGKVDESWDAVQHELHRVMAALHVLEVNASRNSSALNYEKSGEHGVTVIAVGGFSLSRGLTLEGLSVSYFLRNSKMYDTLMQMGRWFGYRPGYEDLCRIWMPQDIVAWYRHIQEATEDLHLQLHQMELAKATPEQFGLAVRSHPDTLLITAKNKMGSGKEIPIKVGLAERLIETAILEHDEAQFERNRAAAATLVRSARSQLEAEPPPVAKRGYLLAKVAVKEILTFLRSARQFKNLRWFDLAHDPVLIADYIEARADSELAFWDVYVASSSTGKIDAEFHELQGIKANERSVERSDGYLTIGGKKRRVGSTEDESVGLTDTQVQEARDKFRAFNERAERDGRGLNPRFYRQVAGRRPLLILRFVVPKDEPTTRPFLTWGLSFPSSQVAGGTVEYVVNTVRFRELYGDVEVDDDEVENDRG